MTSSIVSFFQRLSQVQFSTSFPVPLHNVLHCGVVSMGGQSPYLSGIFKILAGVWTKCFLLVTGFHRDEFSILVKIRNAGRIFFLILIKFNDHF